MVAKPVLKFKVGTPKAVVNRAKEQERRMEFRERKQQEIAERESRRVEGMAVKIAKAADAEGFHEKDVVRFDDLVSKYHLEGWMSEDVKDATRINASRSRKVENLCKQLRDAYYGVERQTASVSGGRVRVPECFVPIKPVPLGKMRTTRRT